MARSVDPRRRPLEASLGRTVTFGYLYPRRLFKGVGLDPEHDLIPEFAGSHRSVVEWVANGKAEAGACFADAPSVLLGKDNGLRVLAQTDLVPGDPVVVSTSFPQAAQAP